MLVSKIIVICLKLRAKLRFLGFLNAFGIFSHEVVLIWFVCHETWHTTLFCIYYCVEKVRVERNNHMREITCLVAFLWFLKRFWHFLA